MKSRFVWGCVALLGLLTAGCGGSPESTAGGNERADAEYKMEQRLAEIGARMDSLRAEVDAMGAAAKVEVRQAVDELEVARQRASEQLAQMRAATADRWETVKLETADMLDALDRRLDRARTELREEK